MNKYKKGFTSEEAALISLGLGHFTCTAQAHSSTTNEQFRTQKDHSSTFNLIDEAGQIRDALIEEVMRIYEYMNIFMRVNLIKRT